VQASSKAVEIDAMQEMTAVHSDVSAALENWYTKHHSDANNPNLKKVEQ